MLERRIQMLCAYSGLAFVALFVGGFWFVAGLVPPPSASDSAQQIARFYAANADQLRAGMLIALIATPLLVPFIVLLSSLLRRSDPRLSLLAQVQLACGALLVVEVLICVVLIGTAAFRPERSPEVTQALNDTAFTFLLWAFTAPTLEYAAIGIAVLLDGSERPLFPRWVGYFDLALALLFAAGGPTLFVKGGAFGWDGVLAFWAVLVGFTLWVLITFSSMVRALAHTAPAPP